MEKNFSAMETIDYQVAEKQKTTDNQQDFHQYYATMLIVRKFPCDIRFENIIVSQKYDLHWQLGLFFQVVEIMCS